MPPRPDHQPADHEPADDERQPASARSPSAGGVRPAVELARFAGLGLQLAASICVLGFAGLWLDRRLGTLPLLLIAGVFAGFLGGTWSIVRQVSRWRGSPASDPRHPH